MKTAAQVVLFGLDDKKVYVTEVTFPNGDEGYELWTEAHLPSNTRVQDDTANCWVHYMQENTKIVSTAYRIERAEEAITWFRYANAMAGGSGKPGRQPSNENQRKTWKEAQGREPIRRLEPLIVAEQQPVRLRAPISDEDFGISEKDLQALMGKGTDTQA